MGKKKLEEFRSQSVEELKEKMLSLKADLAKERALISSGTRAENPGKIKKMRKNIARILTIISQKKKREVKKSK